MHFLLDVVYVTLLILLHGAVLRMAGSPMMFSSGKSGSCSATVALYSTFVTTQMASGGVMERARLYVCLDMVSLPTICRNCLGVCIRLCGQNRVPRPPAKITTCIACPYLCSHEQARLNISVNGAPCGQDADAPTIKGELGKVSIGD